MVLGDFGKIADGRPSMDVPMVDHRPSTIDCVCSVGMQPQSLFGTRFLPTEFPIKVQLDGRSAFLPVHAQTERKRSEQRLAKTREETREAREATEPQRAG